MERRWGRVSGYVLQTTWQWGNHVSTKRICHSHPSHLHFKRKVEAWLPATEKGLDLFPDSSRFSCPDFGVSAGFSSPYCPAFAVGQSGRSWVPSAEWFGDPCSLYSQGSAVLCFWSDAAFANNEVHKTQGGWLLGLASKDLSKGEDVNNFPVHCIGWKLYRLPRVVSSTLSQVKHKLLLQLPVWLNGVCCSWQNVLMAPFRLEQSLEVLQRRQLVRITDCRSLYDHPISLGSGGTLDDKRTALDVAIRKVCPWTLSLCHIFEAEKFLCTSVFQCQNSFSTHCSNGAGVKPITLQCSLISWVVILRQARGEWVHSDVFSSSVILIWWSTSA